MDIGVCRALHAAVKELRVGRVRMVIGHDGRFIWVFDGVRRPGELSLGSLCTFWKLIKGSLNEQVWEEYYKSSLDFTLRNCLHKSCAGHENCIQ